MAALTALQRTFFVVRPERLSNGSNVLDTKKIPRDATLTIGVNWSVIVQTYDTTISTSEWTVTGNTISISDAASTTITTQVNAAGFSKGTSVLRNKVTLANGIIHIHYIEVETIDLELDITSTQFTGASVILDHGNLTGLTDDDHTQYVLHTDIGTNGMLARTAAETYTGRTISGATGLTVSNGDGVSGNPTIDYDVNALTADATPAGATDYVVTYDADAAAHKKVLLDNLPGTGGDVVDDLTPALGGDLDVNSKEIISIGATDIAIHSDNDVNITLGDLIGVDDLNIKNSSGTTVASVNTFGNATFRGLATVDGVTGTAGGLRLEENSANGTDGITIRAPNSLAADQAITLPDATDTLVGKATTDTFTNKSGSNSQWTNDAGYITATLTNEEVEDIAGPLVATGGTKVGISITYQDTTGDMDFTVSDTTVAGDTGSTGVTPGDTLTIAGGTEITTAMSGDTLTINADFTPSSTDTLTNKTFDANGTGNSLSNVDVADLANGTDGELITWDAAGAPATVAVGTSTHVLTSNGVGVAPTFQAAPGGADTFASIEVDGVAVSTAAPTLDFDGVDFTLTESPTDDFDITINAERIEDIAGGMWTGNTETGITVTYQDADGTIDAVVSDTTVAGDSGSTGITPGDTLTIAGGTEITTAMSGDTLTINADFTPSSTDTLTNKTFDANGTGNSLSNVDVADLANGTDGELITWSAAGAPTTVAVGTATHVLTSNGVGTAPTFQAAAGGGGDLVLIASATASASATIDFTGLDSTYHQYVVVVAGLQPATDGANLYARIGTGGTPTYQSGASDYAYGYQRHATTSAYVVSTGASQIQIQNGHGNAAGEEGGLEFFIQDPSAAGHYTTVSYKSNLHETGSGNNLASIGSGKYLADTAVTAIRFLYSSGNIATGTFRLYGMSDA